MKENIFKRLKPNTNIFLLLSVEQFRASKYSLTLLLTRMNYIQKLYANS